MSRDSGFPIADIDVGILSDLKFRRLRAELSEAKANAATTPNRIATRIPTRTPNPRTDRTDRTEPNRPKLR